VPTFARAVTSKLNAQFERSATGWPRRATPQSCASGSEAWSMERAIASNPPTSAGASRPRKS
jgi:hypothetical protein